ncbi:hypothetical protein GCM10010156_21990 [Planobispora rosea]|uniref:Uncharacterized protein n=1 Tax=Planobispora rosea TaxID=35762 RepID=A0A8J3WCQ5_PLARO|nr:hypothetical protein [Planobispora rosea]GGS62630.1 hypothetical protein GCM10010156_21990 [Planobispora rosea]GIH84288.1 hypothetical protein Pro02_26960 [Planobispora rosea]
MRIATPLLTGALLLTLSCGTGTGTGTAAGSPTGSGGSGTATTPSQPVSHTVPPKVEPTLGPKPTKPTGDADAPRKVRWLKAKPSKDRRHLRVTWWSGVEPCHVLDRVTVKETSKKVTVTLWEGPSSKVKNAVCIEIAIQKVTTVKLKKPLAGRKVVDGAKR